MIDVKRVLALAAKEWWDLRATPSVMAGPLLMLATAVAVPFAVAFGVPAWTGESLADAEDLVALARSALGDRLPLDMNARRGAEAAVQAYLLGQFLPLLVLVPVVGAMALVTTSIVDEMKNRSLEPLLATPISTLELLLAKAGSAFVVAMAMLGAGIGLYAVLAMVWAAPGVGPALLSPSTRGPGARPGAGGRGGDADARRRRVVASARRSQRPSNSRC